MLSENGQKENRKLYFRPELTHCPHCEKKLRRAGTVWHKKITMLNGNIDAWSTPYTCKNMTCLYKGIFYKSAEVDMLSINHLSYGYDVHSFLGELDFKQAMPVIELTTTVQEAGIHSIERVRQVLDETTELNGGILLSIEGVQPVKGIEILYVIREVFSGTVVAAKSMKSETVPELQAFILSVIELGFPIVGIVFDGQYCIRLAFEGLLPGLPYQYSEYRYISKPRVYVDRKLKKRLKKKMRFIRDLERKIEQVETRIDNEPDQADTSSGEWAEIKAAKRYITATRALLMEGGNPPYNLPGMLIYERARAIQASCSRYLNNKGATNP